MSRFRLIVIWIFGIYPAIFLCPRRRRSGKSECPELKTRIAGTLGTQKAKIIRSAMSDLVRENVRHDIATNNSTVLRRKARTGLYSDAVNGVFRPASRNRIKDPETPDESSRGHLWHYQQIDHRIQDGEAMGMIFRIYNDFAMHRFQTSHAPARFAPLRMYQTITLKPALMSCGTSPTSGLRERS